MAGSTPRSTPIIGAARVKSPPAAALTVGIKVEGMVVMTLFGTTTATNHLNSSVDFTANWSNYTGNNPRQNFKCKPIGSKNSYTFVFA